MDWIEEKNKLFNDLYLPLFVENGFKKRGWEFYKEIEKDKIGAIVKLYTSGNNWTDSVSFWILIGLKFNSDYPKSLKKGNITLAKCDISFSIIELLYPEESVVKGEYWYNIGETFDIFKPDSQIGSIKVSESSFYGARTGTEVTTLERISEFHIKNTSQAFDEHNNLLSQHEYIYLDTSRRYDTKNPDSIRKQLTEDIAKVFAFLKELENVNVFERKDTRSILSDELKKRIIEKLGATLGK